MITPTFKLWSAVSALAALGAVVYGIGSGGERHGIIVLGFLAAAAIMLAIAGAAQRDGTVPASADEGPAPPAGPVTAPSAWPVVTAFGLVIVTVGLVADVLFVAFGALVLAAAAVEWAVQAWSERQSGDPVHNRVLRDRLLGPVEIPVLALVGTAFVIIGISRVLLALPQTGSTFTAIVVASIILAVTSLLAVRPRLGTSVIMALVVLGGAAVVGGGVVGAVAGERGFYHVGEPDREVTVVAERFAFDTDRIEAQAGEILSVTLENRDNGVPHNIAFLIPGATPERVATKGARSPVRSGPAETRVVLRLPERAGTYEFRCDVHPDQMHGSLEVRR